MRRRKQHATKVLTAAVRLVGTALAAAGITSMALEDPLTRLLSTAEREAFSETLSLELLLATGRWVTPVPGLVFDGATTVNEVIRDIARFLADPAGYEFVACPGLQEDVVMARTAPIRDTAGGQSRLRCRVCRGETVPGEGGICPACATDVHRAEFIALALALAGPQSRADREATVLRTRRLAARWSAATTEILLAAAARRAEVTGSHASGPGGVGDSKASTWPMRHARARRLPGS